MHAYLMKFIKIANEKKKKEKKEIHSNLQINFKLLNDFLVFF